ncbi:MAG: hypothetical protein ACOVN7_13440 [Rubrivivax sp.]
MDTWLMSMGFCLHHLFAAFNEAGGALRMQAVSRFHQRMRWAM